MSSDALAAYVGAVENLYEAGRAAGGERGAPALGPDVERHADAVVDASEAATLELSTRLASDDAEARELAELQLLAAAALDLLTAADLATSAAGDGARVERAAAEAPRDELLQILATPSEAGMRGLFDEEIERGGSADPAKAREELLTAVDDVLQDIVEDAGRGGMALVSGVLALPAPPLQEAANAGLREVLDVLGQKVSALLSRAVALVRRAVDKIMQALGKDARDAARKEAASWIDKIKDGDVLGAMLTKLYDPERIRAEVEAQVPSDADADSLVTAREQITELAARFRKHRTVIQWLARGLALLKNWLLGMVPAGPIALVGLHAAGLGYIVYLGGDYADWHRTDRFQTLNVVPGVRDVVASHVAAR